MSLYFALNITENISSVATVTKQRVKSLKIDAVHREISIEMEG